MDYPYTRTPEVFCFTTAIYYRLALLSISTLEKVKSSVASSIFACDRTRELMACRDRDYCVLGPDTDLGRDWPMPMPEPDGIPNGVTDELAILKNPTATSDRKRSVCRCVCSSVRQFLIYSTFVLVALYLCFIHWLLSMQPIQRSVATTQRCTVGWISCLANSRHAELTDICHQQGRTKHRYDPLEQKIVNRWYVFHSRFESIVQAIQTANRLTTFYSRTNRFVVIS